MSKSLGRKTNRKSRKRLPLRSKRRKRRSQSLRGSKKRQMGGAWGDPLMTGLDLGDETNPDQMGEKVTPIRSLPAKKPLDEKNRKWYIPDAGLGHLLGFGTQAREDEAEAKAEKAAAEKAAAEKAAAEKAAAVAGVAGVDERSDDAAAAVKLANLNQFNFKSFNDLFYEPGQESQHLENNTNNVDNVVKLNSLLKKNGDYTDEHLKITKEVKEIFCNDKNDYENADKSFKKICELEKKIKDKLDKIKKIKKDVAYHLFSQLMLENKNKIHYVKNLYNLSMFIKLFKEVYIFANQFGEEIWDYKEKDYIDNELNGMALQTMENWLRDHKMIGYRLDDNDDRSKWHNRMRRDLGTAVSGVVASVGRVPYLSVTKEKEMDNIIDELRALYDGITSLNKVKINNLDIESFENDLMDAKIKAYEDTIDLDDKEEANDITVTDRNDKIKTFITANDRVTLGKIDAYIVNAINGEMNSINVTKSLKILDEKGSVVNENKIKDYRKTNSPKLQRMMVNVGDEHTGFQEERKLLIHPSNQLLDFIDDAQENADEVVKHHQAEYDKLTEKDKQNIKDSFAVLNAGGAIAANIGFGVMELAGNLGIEIVKNTIDVVEETFKQINVSKKMMEEKYEKGLKKEYERIDKEIKYLNKIAERDRTPTQKRNLTNLLQKQKALNMSQNTNADPDALNIPIRDDDQHLYRKYNEAPEEEKDKRKSNNRDSYIQSIWAQACNELNMRQTPDAKIALDKIIGPSGILDDVITYLDASNRDLLDIPLTSIVMMGEKGVGKTQWARVYCRALELIGFSVQNKFTEINVTNVTDAKANDITTFTKMAEQYAGGVIFIDEAYDFYIDEREQCSEGKQQIITTMMTHIENRFQSGTGDPPGSPPLKSPTYVFAGYTFEMLRFLDYNQNSGLSDRFPTPRRIILPTVGDDAMIEIIYYHIRSKLSAHNLDELGGEKIPSEGFKKIIRLFFNSFDKSSWMFKCDEGDPGPPRGAASCITPRLEFPRDMKKFILVDYLTEARKDLMKSFKDKKNGGKLIGFPICEGARMITNSNIITQLMSVSNIITLERFEEVCTGAVQKQDYKIDNFSFTKDWGCSEQKKKCLPHPELCLPKSNGGSGKRTKRKKPLRKTKRKTKRKSSKRKISKKINKRKTLKKA